MDSGWTETSLERSDKTTKSVRCPIMKPEVIRLWRSWLVFPVPLSASSYSRPCWRSCRAFWLRAVSSVEAHSLILHVGQSPPASSCCSCSASEHHFSFYCPGLLHLCFGHFHFFAREQQQQQQQQQQPPAAQRSAPYLDIQAWLERLK